MQYYESVFDRIEQSFIFMKNNFASLVIPYLIFYIGVFFLFKVIWMILLWWFNATHIYSSWNINLVAIILLLTVLYLTLEIWVILWLYKSICDIDSKKEIKLEENYKYWFSNILKSFQTYYYIFIYVYGIPALLFIFWGLYFIYIQQWNMMAGNGLAHMYNFIGIWILFVLGFFFYIAYRSNKTVFSIVSAVEKNNFEKQNFNTSVSITKWNWWRILWNFILVWLMIWLMIWIINYIMNSIFSSGWNSMDMILKNINNPSQIDYTTLLESLKSNYELSIPNIIKEIFWRIIMILWLIYTSIFTYFFYKRIEKENISWNDEQIIIEEWSRKEEII